jgi:hypothetical protein
MKDGLYINRSPDPLWNDVWYVVLGGRCCWVSEAGGAWSEWETVEYVLEAGAVLEGPV